MVKMLVSKAEDKGSNPFAPEAVGLGTFGKRYKHLYWFYGSIVQLVEQ